MSKRAPGRRSRFGHPPKKRVPKGCPRREGAHSETPWASTFSAWAPSGHPRRVKGAQGCPDHTFAPTLVESSRRFLGYFRKSGLAGDNSKVRGGSTPSKNRALGAEIRVREEPGTEIRARKADGGLARVYVREGIRLHITTRERKGCPYRLSGIA